MGESRRDLVNVAFELNRLGAASIPVNFFLPVEGHAIKRPEHLSADDCLKILSVFRMVNPAAEIRMAAGREVYLADRQAEGLHVANSLFVSGYLNVKGSSAEQTIRLIYENGYSLDEQCEREIIELRDRLVSDAADFTKLQMKGIEELRPFQNRAGQ
jgi:biotin synthase